MHEDAYDHIRLCKKIFSQVTLKVSSSTFSDLAFNLYKQMIIIDIVVVWAEVYRHSGIGSLSLVIVLIVIIVTSGLYNGDPDNVRPWASIDLL